MAVNPVEKERGGVDRRGRAAGSRFRYRRAEVGIGVECRFADALMQKALVAAATSQ